LKFIVLSWFQSLSFYCQAFSDEFKVCAIGVTYNDMTFILTTQILCFAPFFFYIAKVEVKVKVKVKVKQSPYRS